MKLNQTARLILRTLLLVGLSACSGLNQSDKPKHLRVSVGQIKEISLSTPQDSTFQLTGSSENKEIVEVSNQQLNPADASPAKPQPTGRTVFIIKGITPGTAKVVLAEKGKEEAGNGRIRKTYLVEVINR
jgi:hypothetical protein